MAGFWPGEASPDLAELQSHGIGLVDLVAVNLYPFARVVAEPGAPLTGRWSTSTSAGRPCRGRRPRTTPDVIPVCRPVDYRDVLDDSAGAGGTCPQAQRRSLAQAAFAHTAAYDAAIAAWLGMNCPGT